MMNIRNISCGPNGVYDCEIEHEQYGWIPFTASSDDIEDLGREVHSLIDSGKFGAVAPYTQDDSYTREEIEAARKAAYANPYTGSDRLFAEAQRMQLMNEAGWEDVRDQAIQRFTEIQNQYPWE